MPAPKKFDEATREQAVRMYRDRLEQYGEAKVEARRQVGAVREINQATIHDGSHARQAVRAVRHRLPARAATATARAGAGD